MKKTIAYTVTAILLGFAIMMLPLALKTNSDGIPGEERLISQFYGLGKQPFNLLPSILILFSGLIVALGVYAILKRRMI